MVNIGVMKVGAAGQVVVWIVSHTVLSVHEPISMILDAVLFDLAENGGRIFIICRAHARLRPPSGHREVRIRFQVVMEVVVRSAQVYDATLVLVSG